MTIKPIYKETVNDIHRERWDIGTRSYRFYGSIFGDRNRELLFRWQLAQMARARRLEAVLEAELEMEVG